MHSKVHTKYLITKESALPEKVLNLKISGFITEVEKFSLC